MRGRARVEQQGFENEWEVHIYGGCSDRAMCQVHRGWWEG